MIYQEHVYVLVGHSQLIFYSAFQSSKRADKSQFFHFVMFLILLDSALVDSDS